MSIRPNYAELDATKIPTAIDIAWAAGVYEGEGNVRLCGKTKRGLALAVVQKDPEILIRLRDWFGGSIHFQGRVKNPVHTWDACGDRARIFIALIYPFLSARRKVQADFTGALEFLNGSQSDGMTPEDLQLRLQWFNQEKKKNTWNGSERSAIRKANYEKRKAADPSFLPTLIARNKIRKERKLAEISISESPVNDSIVRS